MGARGILRIYLGAAPGVGKTYKMLGEACRRKSRGTDVVVGVVVTHGRVETAAQLADLEVVPLKEIDYRGTVLREMDLDAVLARRPQVVLVDEYAHTNAPGSKNEKRWQDVEQLLEAGIDVISTLNIQHLESLNDVISRITGTTQRETVPDDIVRRADQTRTGRHDARSDPPPACSRQHLPGRTDRRGPRQLLPPGQPRCVARVGVAVGRGPCRGVVAELPRRARHVRFMGDARARRRGHHRCPGR